MGSYLPFYAWWLIGGITLFGLSFIVPRPSIAAMGLAGILTGLLALVVPAWEFQIIFWVIAGVFLNLFFDRVFSQPPAMGLESALEGQVVTRIPANGTGRVSYEGTTWRARCQKAGIAIAPDQPVRVIGRQRNTLLVLPAPANSPAPTSGANSSTDVNISDS